jgi:hypothetical protein
MMVSSTIDLTSSLGPLTTLFSKSNLTPIIIRDIIAQLVIYDKSNANYNHHNKWWNEGQVISSMLDKNKTIATKGKS